MLTQQQSPLFRLPRELRDYIYEQYAHDDEGVFYDYASGKLWYANQSKHEERKALIRSCKRAAEEMRGAVARANTITFFPARSDNDGITYNDLQSKAGRFERLLQSARRMKVHILHHVAKAGCVTPAMVDQVAARFPGIAFYYRQLYDCIKDGRLTRDSGGWGWPNDLPIQDWEMRWQTSATFCEAIQYTLELASSHCMFDDIAAEASASPYWVSGMMPPFMPGSHKAVLGWKPDWWLIPTETDLALETYLTDPFLPDEQNNLDFPEPVVPVAWYWSATAVAIDFLKALPRAQRMRLREPIVIREEMRGAAYPESHIRGLAPYLLENPKLRCELHVGFWTNLMDPVWLQSLTYDHSLDYGSILNEQMLRPFVDFLDEIMSMPDTTVRNNALRIYVEGRKDESVAMWQLIKHVASLQEAMARSDVMQAHQEIRLRDVIIEPHPRAPSSLATHALEHRFLLPCSLPDSFHLGVRDITRGASLIHFDGDPGALWDSESEISARKAWTVEQFAKEWISKTMNICLRMPPGGVTAYMKMYELQAFWHGSQPWVWKSQDGKETLEYYPKDGSIRGNILALYVGVDRG